MLVFTDSYTSLMNTIVFPRCFVHNVVNGFFSHGTEHLLQNHWHTEFPLHQVSDKHHQVLTESLEHEQVCLYIVDVLDIFLDGCIDFLKERIWQAIDIGQHLFAS